MENMLEGKVDWFNDKLGFGYIKKNDGQIIYIHYKDIECFGHRSLRAGEKVIFSEVSVEDRGTRARVHHKHVTSFERINNLILRKFLRWLVYKGSVRYMWCKRKNTTYVSMVRYYLFSCKLIEVYIHQFLDDDEDVFHDHPWNFLSITLAGQYDEHLLGEDKHKTYSKLSWVYRSNHKKHRITVENTFRGKTLTLVLTGFRKRAWNFYYKNGRKVTTKNYGYARDMEVLTYQKDNIAGMIFPVWKHSNSTPQKPAVNSK